MNKEELLKEAYSKYPENTIIYSSIDNKDGGQIIVKYPLSYEKQVNNSKDVIWNNDYGWLHSSGRWATVIEYPKNYIPVNEELKIIIW